MADLHTITIDLDDIRTRAETISQIRINRNTTPDDVLRETMQTLALAVDACRLAEYAVKVEAHKADQALFDAGYDTGSSALEDGPHARQITQFRQYADSFERRIAALERELERRRDRPSPPEAA